MSLAEQARSIPRGLEVIKNWLGEGGTVVHEILAQKRANICLACPCNQKGSILKAAFAEAVRFHLEVKNQLGIRVQGEKSLGECSVCMCQLRLKVHVPIETVHRHMMPGEREILLEKAPQCWQINERP